MKRDVRDLDHPIVDQPWEYRIAELRYVAETIDQEAFIDMILIKGDELRRLRFSSPSGLKVDEGFDPLHYIGLQIVDMSSRQLEDIGVAVSCFENTAGLRFFARAVEAI